MDLLPGPEVGRYVPDPAPTKRQLLSAAFIDHLRHLGRIPATIRYTTQGLGRVRRSSRKLTRTDHAIYPATDVHESPAHPGAQVRHRHPGAD